MGVIRSGAYGLGELGKAGQLGKWEDLRKEKKKVKHTTDDENRIYRQQRGL